MAKQDLISTHMSMSTLQGSSKFETTNDPKSISINIPMLCNMLIKILKIVARIITIILIFKSNFERLIIYSVNFHSFC